MIDVRPAAEEAERQLRALYGERLLSIGLWMPDCDADDGEEPDVELLAVLEGDFNRWSEVRRMSDIASAAGGREGVFLLILPLSQEEYASPHNDLLGQQIREALFK